MRLGNTWQDFVASLKFVCLIECLCKTHKEATTVLIVRNVGHGVETECGPEWSQLLDLTRAERLSPSFALTRQMSEWQTENWGTQCQERQQVWTKVSYVKQSREWTWTWSHEPQGYRKGRGLQDRCWACIKRIKSVETGNLRNIQSMPGRLWLRHSQDSDILVPDRVITSMLLMTSGGR